jgi:hypothetical protein
MGMTTPMAAFAPVESPLLDTASAVEVGDVVVVSVNVAKVEGRSSVAVPVGELLGAGG